MKYFLTVTLATLALAGVAIAGEGNGEPFPGPDAAVREDVSKPHYTMGATAPFNFFYTANPTNMGSYHAAAGANQDPYPFKMNGQVIQVAPTPRSAIVSAPRSNNHG